MFGFRDISHDVCNVLIHVRSNLVSPVSVFLTHGLRFSF